MQGKNVVVLAIEVDPPRSGDRFHTLRKAFDNFHRGTIFVRKNGKTHPAEPEDIENLERRAQGTRLDVRFGLAGADQIRWFDRASLENAVADIADHQRSSQLARARNYNRQPGAPDPFGITRHLAAAQILGKERRSFDAFEQQVAEWCAKWREGAPQHWIQKYMEAGHGVYMLGLANLTDENFRSVRVCFQADEVHIVDDDPFGVRSPAGETERHSAKTSDFSISEASGAWIRSFLRSFPIRIIQPGSA